MKTNIKIFLYSLLAILSVSLQNCKDEEDIAESLPVDYINIRVEAEAEENGEILTIASLRLLVFNSAGQRVANEVYLQSNYTSVLKKQETGNDYWEISLSAPMVIKSENRDDKYDIYAVLNENGFSSKIDDNTSLSERLADNNLNKESFLNLLNNTALLYDKDASQAPNGTPEPAFVMCAYKTNVTIPKNATLKNPYYINLDQNGGGESTGRTMAMISLNRISGTGGSYTIEDGNTLHTVSQIMVLDVSIVNIPPKYAWNNNTSADAGNMLTIPVTGDMSASYDNENITFFNREWDGEITQTVYAECTTAGVPTDEDGVEARLYNFRKSGGNKGWLLMTDYSSRENIPGAGNDQLINGLYYPYTWNVVGTNNFPSNGGNLQTYINGQYINYRGEYTWIDSTVVRKNEQTIFDKGEDWTVNINKSWYVPENIPNNKDKATGLKITLALAEAKLDGFDWHMKDIAWGNITDYVDENGISVKNDLSGNAGAFINKYARTCYADNPSITQNSGDFDPNHGQFWYYIGPIYAIREGEKTETFSSNTEGVDLFWQVEENTIVEFFVPINENGYNIDRNTKYSVSVIVNETAYEILKSKGGTGRRHISGESPITLQVETTKLNIRK